MFYVNLQYYTKVFLLLLIVIDFTISYKMMSIDNHKLCSPVTNRKIQLETELSSGLIVTLGKLKDHTWQWEQNFVCTFHVKPLLPDLGIFIVIQNIVFRKTSTGDCIDYVQYKASDGLTSKKYCETLSAAMAMDRIFASDAYATESTPTVNSFISKGGEVEVQIYISREPLKTYEEMDLSIVFTLFSPCRNAPHQHECSSKYTDYCIYKGFFNDGYINCPYPDCVDEDGCIPKLAYDPTHNSIGNSVVIGSVTTLLVVFVLFISCIWLCRKYKKLCWTDNFASHSNTNQRDQSVECRETSNQNISVPSTARDTFSASSLTANSEEDKDLPPTYDSLFPNR